MRRIDRSTHLTLLCLTCLLLFVVTVSCDSRPEAPLGPSAPPSKPTLTPTGTELVLDPGMAQNLHSTSPGAERFEWALQGEGKISSGEGDTVLYTAPEHSGAVALITVVAHNEKGASPQSSISISTAAAPAVGLGSIGIPGGWMAAGDPATEITLSGSTAGCHSGADCFQIRYKAASDFAGIVWWPKSCGPSGTPAAWQRARDCSCATDLLRAGNLRTVSRVSFWARGERGREVVELKVGDETLCPTPARSSGDLTLTSEWRRYEIDLAGLDLKRAVALFAWVATKLHNPKGATFYLDDVQFEGSR